MDALEKAVRSIEQEGLVWGSSKLVAIGYGIKKLQITLVIEDELVSVDELQEKIAEFEDWVQSTDVQAMQSKCGCLYLNIVIDAGPRALSFLQSVLPVLFCRFVLPLQEIQLCFRSDLLPGGLLPVNS